jgi:hypothetical protein
MTHAAQSHIELPVHDQDELIALTCEELDAIGGGTPVVNAV